MSKDIKLLSLAEVEELHRREASEPKDIELAQLLSADSANRQIYQHFRRMEVLIGASEQKRAEFFKQQAVETKEYNDAVKKGIARGEEERETKAKVPKVPKSALLARVLAARQAREAGDESKSAKAKRIAREREEDMKEVEAEVLREVEQRLRDVEEKKAKRLSKEKTVKDERSRINELNDKARRAMQDMENAKELENKAKIEAIAKQRYRLFIESQKFMPTPESTPERREQFGTNAPLPAGAKRTFKSTVVQLSDDEEEVDKSQVEERISRSIQEARKADVLQELALTLTPGRASQSSEAKDEKQQIIDFLLRYADEKMKRDAEAETQAVIQLLRAYAEDKEKEEAAEAAKGKWHSF